jgi:hypothetical protein
VVRGCSGDINYREWETGSIRQFALCGRCRQSFNLVNCVGSYRRAIEGEAHRLSSSQKTIASAIS